MAVDAHTGNARWRSRELGDAIVIVAGQLLVAVRENGQVVIANATPDGIEVLWRETALSGRCWTGPVIAGGLLLVRDQEKLIAWELPE